MCKNITFLEYAQQKTQDSMLLNDYFPGIVYDPTRHIISAPNINVHMYDVKSRLDNLFGRQLSWIEIDSYSQTIMQYIATQEDSVTQQKNESAIHVQARFSLKVRKKFCKIFNLEFPISDKEYITNYIRSATNVIFSTQKIVEPSIRTCKKCGKILNKNETDICAKCKNSKSILPGIGS